MKMFRFIALLFYIAIAGPQVAIAQQAGSLPRIGLLIPGSPDAYSQYVSQFMLGLKELEKIEDRDFFLDIRWAGGNLDQLSKLATELVDSKVDVLVVSSAGAAVAAQKATTSIPIVQASGGDPVVSGVATSFPRPGGNLTGISNMAEDLSGKSLERLLLMAPDVSRVGILINPNNPAHASRLAEIRQASTVLHVQAVSLPVSRNSLDQLFAKIVEDDIGALMVLSDGMFLTDRRSIIDRVAKARIPAIYQIREFVFDGGLMSYGINIGANYRRAAALVVRILKGAKPADLPIERPFHMELVINLKTAEELGRKVPRQLLIGADKFVE
jgi:putative ABC transport system substrate-binding protein